jgi:hypothetical protein
MPDERLELKEVINFVGCLTTICFMASSELHVREFVYSLSEVGGSYQLHWPFVLSYN